MRGTGKTVNQNPVHLYRYDHVLFLDNNCGLKRKFYELSMVDGRKIKSGSTFLNQGIDIKYLEKGIYVLEISGEREKVIKK